MDAFSRREFANVAASALAAVIFPLASVSTASATTADPLAFVDPELRPAARQLLSMAGQFPPPSVANLPTMRAGMTAFERPWLPGVPVVERRVPGLKGNPEVRVYVINAKPGTQRPGILHTHGGGFITGSAKLNVPDLQDLATALDAVIVTVDYRLAPETLYSGSVEDNYAGLKWMYSGASELGLDVKRIAVTGESAGGGHAALLAIRARDRGEIPIMFQSLVYPMLDDRTGSSLQLPAQIGSLLWTPEQNRFGWRSFLGQEPGSTSVPAAAVPARTVNLSGLPPAWIGVGSIDLFVREDIEYARRLIETGIATELLVVPGAYHGFDQIAATTSPAVRFRQARLNALKRAFTAAVR